MRRVLLLLLVSVIAILSAQHLGEPQHKRTLVKWGVEDSKSYARDQLYKWQQKQWSCLSSLWGKESAWNPRAYNTIKVSGRNAGGIPQLLGLDPATPATRQIERGLDYIYHRYETPCNAWEFFKRKGWH
jgi:hypothetical protein